jgi:DNA-3-methyladenine glycosylase II
VSPVATFRHDPAGPFDLLFQNRYFNFWPAPASDPDAIVLTFPLEGLDAAAAVTLRQEGDGSLTGHVYGPGDHADQARRQALASMSLDIDGVGWPDVGERDEVIGRLQLEYHHIRPALFHSPYEAAASFTIGHRTSIRHARAIRQRMATDFGDTVRVEDESFHAFPHPRQLSEVRSYKGLDELKIERLHAVARAASDGWLDRDRLRLMPEDEALSRLEGLPGVGKFFAQGILYRGAGLVDGITHDDLTYAAIETAYPAETSVNREAVMRVAECWRPYRMWSLVLLHVWLRGAGELPARTFGKV